MAVRKRTAVTITTLFCCKRILLALTTVYLNSFVIASVYFYCFSSLFTIGFILNNKPMGSKLMNFMEIINEVAVYLSTFVMFFFTEWIPDIEVRYTLGFVYLPGILGIILVNLACVIFEMGVAIKQKVQQKCSKKSKVGKAIQNITDKYENGGGDYKLNMASVQAEAHVVEN